MYEMGFHFLNNICIVSYKGNDRIKLSVLIHLQLILRGKCVHRMDVSNEISFL